MPNVSHIPTERDSTGRTAGAMRLDAVASLDVTTDSRTLVCLDGAVTVTAAVSADSGTVTITATNGTGGRVAIPDSIVIRTNRWLSSLNPPITLHRDWHTKTHGVRPNGQRPVWLESGRTLTLIAQGAGWVTRTAPDASPATPVLAPATPATPPMQGAQSNPARRAGRVAKRTQSTRATLAPGARTTMPAPGTSPKPGDAEPFPVAPCSVQPNAYRTWSGHTVSTAGTATGGRVNLNLNRAALPTSPADDDVTRLNTVLAGWGLSIVTHPTSGDLRILIEPSGTYRSKRKYVTLNQGHAYGGWVPEPAGALPYGGVPETWLDSARCGNRQPNPAHQGRDCKQPHGHTGDHANNEVWPYLSWPDYIAATTAAIAAEDEHPEATEDEPSTDEDLALDTDLPVGAHVYVPQPGLVETFQTGLRAMAAGRPGRNYLFTGPAGSGKGDGAAHLAAMFKLAFTKVDAASITEPEAWFGTREVVDHDGTPVTEYVPSALVRSVQQPGITFVDEITRARTAVHNIFLPLMDGTRRVTNPLTGQVVERHPENILILAANRGLEFVGTFDLDIAATSRVRHVAFTYPAPNVERAIVRQATGLDAEQARVLVAFANETRALAARDTTGIPPMSVREVLTAAEDVAFGLDPKSAVEQAYISIRDGSGGAMSQQQVLRDLWAATNAPADESGATTLDGGAF